MLTQNELSLKNILSEMVADGSASQQEKDLLQSLIDKEKEPEKPQSCSDDQCNCLSCVYNNMVIPEGIKKDDQKLFLYKTNVVLASQIKNTFENCKNQLNSVLEDTAYDKQFVENYYNFLQRYADKQYLAKYSSEVLMDFLDNEAKLVYPDKEDREVMYRDRINEVGNLFKNDKNAHIQMYKYHLYLFEDYLSDYSLTNHEIFLASNASFNQITMIPHIAEMCMNLNLTFDAMNTIIITKILFHHVIDNITKAKRNMPTTNWKDKPVFNYVIDEEFDLAEVLRGLL